MVRRVISDERVQVDIFVKVRRYSAIGSWEMKTSFLKASVYC